MVFQVFQGCGNPKISTKGSSSEDKRRRGKVALEAKSSAQALEMLVSLMRLDHQDLNRSDHALSMSRLLITDFLGF